MRRDDCPFCGALQVEIDLEDACPKWVLRSIQGMRKSDRFRVQTFGRDNRDYPSYTGAISVHAPCKVVCNGGWMSRLERRAKPILRSMIESNPPIAMPLSASDRTLIALWLLKTAMVWDFVLPNTPYFIEDERRMVAAQKIPETIQVWAGRYSGRGFLHQSHNPLQMFSIEGSGVKPTQMTSFGFTFTMGHLTLQLHYLRRKQGVQMKGMLTNSSPGDRLLEVWPARRSVVWPPSIEIGSIDRLHEISMRFGSFKPGDPRGAKPPESWM